MTYEALQFPYLQRRSYSLLYSCYVVQGSDGVSTLDQPRQLEWRYRNSDPKRTTCPRSCAGRGCFDCRDREGDERVELGQRFEPGVPGLKHSLPGNVRSLRAM